VEDEELAKKLVQLSKLSDIPALKIRSYNKKIHAILGLVC
jgi:hypothetical protein